MSQSLGAALTSRPERIQAFPEPILQVLALCRWLSRREEADRRLRWQASVCASATRSIRPLLEHVLLRCLPSSAFDHGSFHADSPLEVRRVEMLARVNLDKEALCATGS
jgi:hypothetical protein